MTTFQWKEIHREDKIIGTAHVEMGGGEEEKGGTDSQWNNQELYTKCL